MDSFNEAWKIICDYCKERITDVAYTTWISKIEPVSLDFAVTFVPEWRGAFFPIYFICGAIYSGLALVIILLMAEHCRVRLLEKLMLALSWIMAAFWLWEFMLKGTGSFEVVFLGVVVPQLLWLRPIRDNSFVIMLYPI